MKEPKQTNKTSKAVFHPDKSCFTNQDMYQQHDENYFALFEQATDAILVTDFAGNFMDVNAGFCTLFGYTKEALLRMNIRTLLDEQHLKEKPIRFDLLAVGENIFNERKMVHKNGTIIYVEANSKKFNDKHILVIARNITERKKAEALIQKSEANLHTIFDTTDTIYILLDNDLRIISYNPPANDFTKNELGRLIEPGKYFPEYFPVEKRSGIQNNMCAVLRGKPANYEVNYPQADGSFNWYHVRMFPISRGDQHIYGLMIAASGITEKRILEQQLLDQKVAEQRKITKAVADAQEKERAEIGEELHDNVNQLLASSKLFLTHSLSHPDELSYISKSREYITAAMEEIRKLSHALVGPTRDKSIGLVDSLHELINDISIVKDMKISFCHSNYCEEESEIELKLVIYRIIQEQLNNILKYAEADEVHISLKKEDDYLTVIINDNGKGFDTAEKRTGIGLKNIKNRAEIYNGVTQIISAPGHGCKMKIIFQLNDS